jgi:cardiolipin-specific phospholipase
LKDLSKYFKLYVIDLLGMGASGRPEYKHFEVDQAEDFFINSIRQWKEQIGLTGKYYLAGHSMGGYISTVYALRYPEDIEKLLLLSPVGVPEKPEEYNAENIAKRMDTLPKKLGTKLLFKLWEK